MKLAVLSRSARSYSTARIVRAATRLGHRVHVLDTVQFGLRVDGQELALDYEDRLAPAVDAIVPRVGSSVTRFGAAVVEQFQRMGAYSIADANAIRVTRDKMRCLQLLAAEGITVPRTAYVHDPRTLSRAVDAVGGPPVIIKVLEGTQGVGVLLAETMTNAESILETLIAAQQHVLVQEFVSESKGRDIRAFVVRGRVVAAMRRIARGDEFRSNVHRGGRTVAMTLDSNATEIALRAASVVGLDVAGVDLLEGKHGLLVNEVNSSPGLEGIETATGIDVARQIVEAIGSVVATPETSAGDASRARSSARLGPAAIVPR